MVLLHGSVGTFPSWTLYLMIGVSVLLAVITYATRTYVYVEAFEYLQVLSYHEWKSVRDIRHEMQKIKGGRINPGSVYDALEFLKSEGCVESRPRDRLFWRSDETYVNYPALDFKLTSQGMQQKKELTSDSEQYPHIAPLPWR